MAEILHRQEIIYERERERERERPAATAITNRKKVGKKQEKILGKSGEESAYNNNAHKSINKCCHYYIPNPRYPILFSLSFSHYFYFIY
jgi:hypothetical protein